MSYLLYLMFRCDKRCDGCDEKFGNFMGTKHTPHLKAVEMRAKEKPEKGQARRALPGRGSRSPGLAFTRRESNLVFLFIFNNYYSVMS